MRNLILTFTAFLFSTFSVFAQNKINTNDLIGYWRPTEESTQLFFWKNSEDCLQSQEISGTSGEPLDLLKMTTEDNKVVIVTRFEPTNYVVKSEYILLDKDTLICKIVGGNGDIIIYKKVK
jgi:hypothetical protein